jgi:hypothetical protein
MRHQSENHLANHQRQIETNANGECAIEVLRRMNVMVVVMVVLTLFGRMIFVVMVMVVDVMRHKNDWLNQIEPQFQSIRLICKASDRLG